MPSFSLDFIDPQPGFSLTKGVGLSKFSRWKQLDVDVFVSVRKRMSLILSLEGYWNNLNDFKLSAESFAAVLASLPETDDARTLHREKIQKLRETYEKEKPQEEERWQLKVTERWTNKPIAHYSFERIGGEKGCVKVESSDPENERLHTATLLALFGVKRLADIAPLLQSELEPTAPTNVQIANEQ